MKEHETVSRIPEADKKAFIADYMTFRDQGFSMKKAHSMAREMASLAMRQAPHFATLLTWIKKGNGGCAGENHEETALKPLPTEEISTEETGKIEKENERKRMEEKTALTIAKALLRLYRKQDKTAVDHICDLLAPAMGGLE